MRQAAFNKKQENKMKKILLLLMMQMLFVAAAFAQTGKFGIFTDNTAVDDSITVGLEADIYVWEETLSPGTVPPYEGDNGMTFQTTGAGWFGGGIQSFEAVNLSSFAEGYLNFMIKMPSNVTFKIGITDSLDNQSFVTFPAGQTIYNLERNGEWDQAVIPVNKFTGVDLSILSYEFVFLEENGASCEFAIDDIYYSLDAVVDPYVEFDSESYAVDAKSGLIKVYDEPRSNSVVSVAVSNGPFSISIDVSLDASGIGTGTVNFGETNEATDTIAIFENGIITVTYLDNAGISRNDAANITAALPDYSFGIFTDDTPVDDRITVGVDADIWVWEGTLVAGTIPPYEGTHVMTFQTVDKGWFGGGVQSQNPLDLSVFEKGHINFMIKIPSDVTFKIGIIDQADIQSYVQFNAGQTMYGLVRNGEWGKVMIPVNDIKGNVDLTTLSYEFVFLEEGGTECEFAIDDVYYSLDPSVYLDANRYTIISTGATIEVNDIGAAGTAVPVGVSSGTEHISVDVILNSSGNGTAVVNFGTTNDGTDTISIIEGDLLTVTYTDNSGNLRTDTAEILGAPSEKYMGIYSESHDNPILENSGIINSADWEGDSAVANQVSTAVTPVDGIFVLEVVFSFINGNWSGIAFDYSSNGHDISKYDRFVINVNKSLMPSLVMLFVKIEDNAGNFHEINLAGITPVINGSWSKYDIPLTSFTGVDMSDIKYILIVNPKSGTNTMLYGTLYFDDIHLYDSTAGIEENGTIEKFSLMQNYPNPFNPSTEIKFNIDRSAMVRLDIYDVNGQLVSTLVNKKLNKGGYTVNWNASGNNGTNLSSGVYFYRLSLDGKAAAAKNMLLLK
jgi:hypothetical protein